MLSLRWKFGVLLALLLTASAWGQVTYNCLPSCDPADARFLAIANGPGLITLSQPTLDLEISVPRGTTTFTVGVFDGDAKGVDGGGVAHWDTSNPATFSYELYADPNRDHAAAVVAPLSGSPSVLSTSMPDNAWIDLTVNTAPSAQAPSGHYFYLLRIQLVTPAALTLNAFKIRTGGAIVGGSSLFPSPEPFSYIANIFGSADLGIIYPSFPSAVPTRYNGDFDFYFDQPVSQPEVTVWDGDFDRGKFDGTDKDTDDPDTPNLPFKPAWSTLDTLFEGVALGLVPSTGNPPDDRNPAGSGIFLVKPPSVRYDLIFPDGRTFANNNPSGNQEWEQFKVSTGLFDPNQMDYSTPTIPPGIYRVRIQGVDMQNLNAILLPGRALCVSQAGSPCTPLRPYLIGDTVFSDGNENGVQDPGEPGIGGVEMELRDANGILITTTHTDANGHYSFEVEAYSYSVRIALSNYTGEGGGTLGGYTPTTPEECQATINNDNFLDCDFGYRRPGAVGDRVWSDFNGNGVQDAGEPGINGVVVNLFDSNGNFVAADTTNGDGNYSITNIPAGNYTVRVDDTYLPGGLTPTYDLDGVATPHEAAVTIVGGQTRTDVDFGYQGNGSIGDRVWNDADADGVQDPGEAGITGVTVRLLDDVGEPDSHHGDRSERPLLLRPPAGGHLLRRDRHDDAARGCDADLRPRRHRRHARRGLLHLRRGRSHGDRRRLRVHDSGGGDGLDRRPRLERRRRRRSSGCRRVRAERRDGAVARRRQQRRGDRHDQRRRQLHLRQSGGRHLHRPDRPRDAPAGCGPDLRRRRCGDGQRRHPHPRHG